MNPHEIATDIEFAQNDLMHEIAALADAEQALAKAKHDLLLAQDCVLLVTDPKELGSNERVREAKLRELCGDEEAALYLAEKRVRHARVGVELARISLAAGLEAWSVSDWACALAGEVGEVCNAVKKLRRVEDGLQQAFAIGLTREDALAAIAREIGDTYAYLDLLAQRLGMDLLTVAASRFNEISEREGFPERMCLRADVQYWRDENARLRAENERLRSETKWLRESCYKFVAKDGERTVVLERFPDQYPEWDVEFYPGATGDSQLPLDKAIAAASEWLAGEKGGDGD